MHAASQLHVRKLTTTSSRVAGKPKFSELCASFDKEVVKDASSREIAFMSSRASLNVPTKMANRVESFAIVLVAPKQAVVIEIGVHTALLQRCKSSCVVTTTA